MRSAEYWRQRFEAVQDLLLKRGEDILPEIEQAFQKAQAELERDMERWYARFAQNNRISLAEAKRLLEGRELSEFRWTVEEYIRRGEENGLDARWMKQLENASARVHISRLESLKLQVQQQAEQLFGNQTDSLDRIARDIYEEGYYRTAFEIQRGTGVGFSLRRFSEAELSKLVSKPWTTDGHTFRDRCWANKQALVNTVHTQLTRDIITGAGPEKSIREIQEQFGVARNKAARLVMTESAYFSAQSQKDCFDSLGIERYEILGTLDGHTCSECGDLDGKVFRQADYQPGVTAPPFHPWCRCTTIPFFNDDADFGLTGERAARGMDGKTRDVPGNLNYGEWKKQFVTTLDSAGPSGILLAEARDAVIPAEKFTLYALNPERQPDKSRAFKLALGYTKENAEDLIQNIREHLGEYTAVRKPDIGYGPRYEIVMDLSGPNGKTARVLTAWIKDQKTGNFRLTTAHIDKR